MQIPLTTETKHAKDDYVAVLMIRANSFLELSSLFFSVQQFKEQVFKDWEQ